MIPGHSPIASLPIAGLPDDIGVVTSTLALALPVDCYMEGLPQYRALGRTYERVRGRAGESVRMSAGPRGRISGPAPKVTVKTSGRGYD